LRKFFTVQSLPSVCCAKGKRIGIGAFMDAERIDTPQPRKNYSRTLYLLCAALLTILVLGLAGVFA